MCKRTHNGRNSVYRWVDLSVAELLLHLGYICNVRPSNRWSGKKLTVRQCLHISGEKELYHVISIFNNLSITGSDNEAVKLFDSLVFI